jgi:hypothetical protein
MLTLNQIIQILNNKQSNHAQLSNGTFLFGDPWEFGAENAITYPLMGVTLNNSSLTGNIFSTSFNIFFCDLVHKDEGNENEVLSDMQRVALDVWSQIKDELEDAYDATVNQTAQLTDFTERFDDEVTGWQMDISIEQFYDQSTCDVPDSNANAGKAYIIDQDGNILQYLNAGEGYTVEILQQIIDTLTNNTSTIIDPLT